MLLPGDDPKECPTPSESNSLSTHGRAGVDGLLYLTDKATQMQEFRNK